MFITRSERNYLIVIILLLITITISIFILLQKENNIVEAATIETIIIKDDPKIDILIQKNEYLLTRVEDIEFEIENTKTSIKNWNEMYNNWTNRIYK